MRQPDLEIRGPLAHSPVVYAWYRGEECLYVGMSSVGIGRPLDAHHHAARFRMHADRILVWECNDKGAAISLERELIETLRPSCNGGVPTDTRSCRFYRRYMTGANVHVSLADINAHREHSCDCSDRPVNALTSV